VFLDILVLLFESDWCLETKMLPLTFSANQFKSGNVHTQRLESKGAVPPSGKQSLCQAPQPHKDLVSFVPQQHPSGVVANPCHWSWIGKKCDRQLLD